MSNPLHRAVALLGGPSGAARKLKLTPGAISQFTGGRRPVPTDRCASIEREVAAQVTCEELRPDVVWVRVPDPGWPHPGGRPCIDVAAPAADACEEQRHAA